MIKEVELGERVQIQVRLKLCLLSLIPHFASPQNGCLPSNPYIVHLKTYL